MPLLPKDEFLQIIGAAPSKAADRLYNVVVKLILPRLKRAYDRNEQFKGVEFVRHLFEDIGMDYHIGNLKNLLNLPNGPFITISNHPYGGVDGLILIDTIGRLRGTYKVMVNKILAYLHTLEENFITVNPTTDHRTAPTSVSLKGIKDSLLQLESGSPLGIFPAGAVSNFKLSNHIEPKEHLSWTNSHVADRPWQESAIRLIQKVNVPVLPVRFLDGNSVFFYLLGYVHWIVRTLRLPHEAVTRNGKPTRVVFGEIIPPEKIASFGKDIDALTAFLRGSVYGMPYPDELVRRSDLSL